MSVCYFLTDQFQKSVEKATKSVELKKSIKGFYRRAKAYAALKNYERAVEDLKEAIKMDTSDPNDF